MKTGWKSVHGTRQLCPGCGKRFHPKSWNQAYCTEDCKLISRIGTKKTRNNGG